MASPAKPFRLYPRNDTPTLDAKLFASPPREYRGSPFWCWNDRLDRSQLSRQIDVMQRMGFGGFHIHSRTGLATEYLGPTWMNLIAMCAEEAERKHMLCWLYDEDRWPSGYAGGLATKDPTFRQRQLLWTDTPYGQNAQRGKTDYTAAVRNETGRLVARYDVELDSEYRLARYRRLRADDPLPAGRIIWYAYIEPATPSTWFNGQTAIDTLSKRAIEHFIRSTHERYRERIGNRFGLIVPAFFTDEPQFVKKSTFAFPAMPHDLFMPIAEDFFDTFRATFDMDLLDHLPELFWNLKDDAPSLARYRFHDHTAERFASAFGDTLANWCEQNGVALTGHMLGEASLMSQTRGCGEAMRGLRSFQLPGIDMLCDKREFTTAKQAQSIAHQFGREGVASELYGVTGWHFDFVGHKAQGDWQAALGVTVRVPHLFWMSMRGEAKRDYPASIGEQSPWFEEYSLIEDHFARVATVLSRGKPATKIAVIHPIESAWLCWGPNAQNARETARLEESFAQLPEWLLFGLADFDYLSESLLARDGAIVALALGTCSNATFTFGAMQYECVIVPPTTTLRGTTLDALERFADAGGAVIFAGEIATCVDAQSSDRVRSLAARCKTIPFDQNKVLTAIASFCDVRISYGPTFVGGSTTDSILHQFRIDGADRHLFLSNTDRMKPRNLRLEIVGRWDIVRHDTIHGTSAPLARSLSDTHTAIDQEITAHGHLLFTLSPPTDRVVDMVKPRAWTPGHRVGDPNPVTLSEPNVLLLDRATLLCEDEATPLVVDADVLRIDNFLRSRLGLSPRTGRGVQPWADASPAPVLARSRLKFEFQSDIDLTKVDLAMENPEDATIHLDGRLISNVPVGWWVDQSIQRVALPPMSSGRHELILTIPFTRKTELEAIYLLGDFGVRVSGSHARVIAPVRSLTWGDWTAQGLPFYGGNVTYHTTINVPCAWTDVHVKIRFPKFTNPLLSVSYETRLLGKVAFAPFEVPIELGPEVLKACGSVPIDITAFGNRGNTFGPLHHVDENLKWIGPAAWRSTNEAWQDEYVLKRMGVLSAPLVYASR